MLAIMLDERIYVAASDAAIIEDLLDQNAVDYDWASDTHLMVNSDDVSYVIALLERYNINCDQ